MSEHILRDARLTSAFQVMRWGLGLGDDPTACESLLARYDEPHRAYHTGAHVQACLRLYDGVRALAWRGSEVECALLYHDAIYDPRSRDNEARSAALARADLERAGCAEDVVARIERAILATRTHELGSAPSDEPRALTDVALVLDLDLAVLASDVETYRIYSDGVRSEHAHVSDAQYHVGRAAFLRDILRRERWYWTDELHARFEARARGNVARELERLEAGPVAAETR
jgi:predicted metal-dependent HD superfamily phosphohydrolase